MSTQHTKGPWNVTKEQSSAKGQIWIESHGILVAIIHKINLPNRKEQAEANARLIAAAPELLEACKLLLDELQNDITDACDIARAAIAKATGEEAA